MAQDGQGVVEVCFGTQVDGDGDRGAYGSPLKRAGAQRLAEVQADKQGPMRLREVGGDAPDSDPEGEQAKFRVPRITFPS